MCQKKGGFQIEDTHRNSCSLKVCCVLYGKGKSPVSLHLMLHAVLLHHPWIHQYLILLVSCISSLVKSKPWNITRCLCMQTSEYSIYVSIASSIWQMLPFSNVHLLPFQVYYFTYSMLTLSLNYLLL